jgi:hypothetical protein
MAAFLHKFYGAFQIRIQIYVLIKDISQLVRLHSHKPVAQINISRTGDPCKPQAGPAGKDFFLLCAKGLRTQSGTI